MLPQFWANVDVGVHAHQLVLESSGRVLIVDDEPAARRIMEKLLVVDGFEVLEAEHGQAALDVLSQGVVDVVLLDMRMPGIDGLEVCRRIRANPKTAHTPILIVTASNDRDVRRQGKQAGADDFLCKPFDDIELLARVRTAARLNLYYSGLEQAVERKTAELNETIARLERVQEQLRASYSESIERLARAAEFRDDETAQHLQRMSHYCYLLARRFGLDPYACEMLRVASPMHDVGKIGIPDHILLKPGRLSNAEYEIMKQHAEIGYRILSGSNSDLLHMAAMIAWTHHEKWDGTGYPRCLKGESIPLEGRISAIADVFDALTSTRPYKRAWALDDALDLMRSGRGIHFDPKLLDLFFDSMDEVLDIRQRFADGP